MSLGLITQAWQHYPEGGPRLNVLQAIAEASNERGSCYLTIRQIAQLARLSKAATKNALDHLRKERWVLTSRMLGRGGKLVYQINLPKLRRSYRDIEPGDAVAIIEQRQQPASATHEALHDRIALRAIARATGEPAAEPAREVAGDWTVEGFTRDRDVELQAAQASCEPSASLQSLPVSLVEGVMGSEEYKGKSSVIRASNGENDESVTKSALLPETLQPFGCAEASDESAQLASPDSTVTLSAPRIALDSASLSRQQDEEGRAAAYLRDAFEAATGEGDVWVRSVRVPFASAQDENQGAEGCAAVPGEHLEPPSASSGADWAGFEPASEGKRPSSRPARRFW